MARASSSPMTPCKSDSFHSTKLGSKLAESTQSFLSSETSAHWSPCKPLITPSSSSLALRRKLWLRFNNLQRVRSINLRKLKKCTNQARSRDQMAASYLRSSATQKKFFIASWISSSYSTSTRAPPTFFTSVSRLNSYYRPSVRWLGMNLQKKKSWWRLGWSPASLRPLTLTLIYSGRSSSMSSPC